MQYCSYSIGLYIHHQSCSQLGVVFCFGSISSFFLVLFFHSSPEAYWVLIDLGVHLSMSYLLTFSILFMGFSRQEYHWSGLSFPSPVNLILPELFTIIHSSCVSLLGIAHSFIEAVVHVISLNSFLWLCVYQEIFVHLLFFSFCTIGRGSFCISKSFTLKGRSAPWVKQWRWNTLALCLVWWWT